MMHCDGCPLPADPESKYLLIRGKFGEAEGRGCPAHECSLVNITWFNQFYPHEAVENVLGQTLSEVLQGKRDLSEEGLTFVEALLDLDREAIEAFMKQPA